MSYQVFARKYRPKTFDDVLGQDHVVRTLRNAITQNRLAHAYLFVGPRGTGKTSTARIFAMALNGGGGPNADFDPTEPLCQEIAEGRCMDVMEIDGASNNGVEQVRELRDNVKFAPIQCRYKIYYIDEVHMLSAQAFNALLKTLEEPPEHVKFIFATTEANKILPTIISRCQRFDLRRIPNAIIAKHLLHIANLEGVNLDEKAAYAIGKGAEGGMRDAQSMLDQLVAFCGNHIREEDVLEIFGFTSGETVATLCRCLLERDTVGALRAVYDQNEAGKDLGRLLGDLIQHVRTLLVYQADPDAATEDVSPEVATQISEQSQMASTEQLLRMVDGLAEVDARMRWATNKRLHFELGVIQSVQALNEVSLTEVIEALDGGPGSGPRPMGNRPAGGEFSSRRAAAPRPAEARPAAAIAPRSEPPARTVAAVEPAPPRPAPAPPTPPPAAAAATPPPEPARAPRGAVATDVVWAELTALIQQRRPLTLHWVQAGTLLEVTDDKLKLGFPPSESSARDSLQRDATLRFMETVAAEIMGKPMKFEMVIDTTLTAPEMPGMLFGIDEPAPAPREEAPAPAPTAEAAPTPAATPADETAEPAMSAAEAAFYNDPLITAAVEKFKLRLVPSASDTANLN